MKKIHQRRYLGNKFKLLPFLIKNILQYTNGETFVDLFAGTGSVTEGLSNYYDKLYVNDFLFSNYIFYLSFFNTDESKINKKKCIDFVNDCIKNPQNNYFSENFMNTFFSEKDSKIIGTIREDLEKKKDQFTNEEYVWILTSLLYSLDKASRSVGHFEAYLKNHDYKKFSFEWTSTKNNPNIIPSNQDVFDFVEKMDNSDVVYLDPPYNSRQYDRAYHVLENVAKWEKPELFGVAKKPVINELTKSIFCTSKATLAFEKLISMLVNKTKYIVISYNNTYSPKSNTSLNKISFEDMKKILESRGKVTIASESYNAFQTGKTELNNHQEVIFVLEVDSNE